MVDELISILYDPYGRLPEDQGFYYQVIEEIEAESLSAQIYFLLKKQGKLEKTPFFFQVCLKQKVQEVLNVNFFIKTQETDLLNQLEKLQVETIPLKGVGFAERYFGHLGARSTTDIDLLIKEQDLDKVVKLVKSAGFTVEEERIPGHFHCSFSKVIPGFQAPLTVEIHWNIIKEETSTLDIEDFWQEAYDSEGYQYIKRFSDYHAFYFACLHGWRHNLDSKKHFLDIIQMIYVLQDSMDYNRLLQETKSHQTFKRISRTLSSVYFHFPFLVSVLPLPDCMSIRKINDSRERRSHYFKFFDYQFFSYDSYRHSLIEISNWLFPNPFELAAELSSGKVKNAYFLNLLCLYGQRGKGFLKTMISSHSN